MVGVASGAGMSSMVIKGSLDTSNITAGFNKVSSGFDSVKGHVKGLHADFSRMNKSVGGLVTKLSALASIGITAIMGIASQAPQIAPALAQMQVAFLRISLALGDALGPAFDRLVGWLGDLSTWIENNKGTIGAVADKMMDWGDKVITFLTPALEGISSWASKNPDLFAGILSGLIIAPAALSGIGAISGLVTTLAGATVGSTVLLALGSLAAIALSGGIAWTAGNAIGDATYSDSKEGFISHPKMQPIVQGALGLQDFLTGGNTSQEYMEQAQIYNAMNREESRKSLLMALWDAVTG